MIHLADITPNHWRLNLRVKEKQKQFVSDEYCLLARAYVFRKFRSRAAIIYSDDVAVGMALYYDCDELKAYIFN